MNKSKLTKLIIALCIAAAFACGWFASGLLKPEANGAKAEAETLNSGIFPDKAEPETAAASAQSETLKQEASGDNPDRHLHIANPANEFLVGASIYQLSAEADSLIHQGFSAVKNNVAKMLEKCADETEAGWQLIQNASGEKEMYHEGKRVAIICDIDDTLVNGINYTADILGNSGDWNNAAFARFLMSDGCTALPGAVECMDFCKENGIEIYYITNRYDQGYKVGQADSRGSYEQYKKEHGEGTYLSKDGDVIGTSIYELYGKSMYDISLESMQKLGFPADDEHLVLNDMKLNGSSKEKARQAVINGCENYSNGQRENENSLNTKTAFSCGAHDVVMLLGDQMTDFTDEFDDGTKTFIERKQLAGTLAEKFGKEWIAFPNAVYGTAIDPGIKYGAEKLFREYAYTN